MEFENYKIDIQNSKIDIQNNKTEISNKDNIALERILKFKLKNNKLDEAIDLLEEEIIKIFESKVKQYELEFEYTSMLSLIEKAEKYFIKKDFIIFKKFYILSNEDANKLYKIDCLVTIYNKLKRGEYKNV